jgi:hypothetical protein
MKRKKTLSHATVLNWLITGRLLTISWRISAMWRGLMPHVFATFSLHRLCTFMLHTEQQQIQPVKGTFLRDTVDLENVIEN